MARKKTVKAPEVALIEEDKTWRAESDLRTLLEADKIKSDRARLSQAKQMARKQIKAVGKVVKRP